MFAGVGERTREGNDLYREMIESGVIKLGDKQVILATSQFLCECRTSKLPFSYILVFVAERKQMCSCLWANE